MQMTLGFDTSNYTTSCAWFDGEEGGNFSRLLPVPEGSLGLRQSDAVFHHVRQLPALVEELSARIPKETVIAAAGASTAPRRVEGSYMPCFLVGEGAARQLCAVKGIPFAAFSHQEGHIAAALWSAGRMDLFETEHLAWHLSGGTTELLHVRPDGVGFQVEIVGGSRDISVGQLIDRTGKRLGLAFPSGKALDALSQDEHEPVSVPRMMMKDAFFPLSGMENKMNRFADEDHTPAAVAAYVFEIVAAVIATATVQIRREFPDLPLVLSGGVASNSLLRSRFADGIFAKPEFSADNAMGVAILTHRALVGGVGA